MRKILPLTLLIFSLGTWAAKAQVNYTAPVMTACGSTVSVPVSVSGFNNVVAFQYSMEWNPAVLQFDNVGSFNLQHLNGPDFGTSQSLSGKLTVAWIDDDGSGETLANGTVIYVLNFTVLGANGSSSAINFTDSPTPKLTAVGSPPTSTAMTTTNGSVTIGDNVPPTITCPSNVTTTIVSPSTNTIVNGIGPVSVYDNCSTPTVNYSTTGATSLTGANNASGGTFNAGTTTVTYTATDAASNPGTCSFTITVNQTTNPFTVTASHETSDCSAPTVSVAISVSSFNIAKALSFTLAWDPAKLSYSSVGNYNLQHLDNGDFGVSQISSGKLTMAWIDEDGTGETLPDGTVIFRVTFTVTGLPGESSPISFTNSPTDIVAGGGQPVVTIPVTTENGSVTIGASSAPVISNCPSNISETNNAGQCGRNITWTAPTASDGCPGLTFTSNKNPGDFFPVGATIVTYLATGITGKTSTCSFNVTIADTEDPNISCPTTITQKTDANKCTAIVIWNASATDNCLGVTVSGTKNSGDVFPLGTTSVTLTAKDASNRTASCSFNVIVRDSVGPVFTNCPKDTVLVVAFDKCAINYTWSVPTATDACTTPATTTSTHNPGASFAVGKTTVTYTSTDAAGNKSTCIFTVTVLDPYKPKLAPCPPDITVNASAGTCQAVVTWANPTASDNCPTGLKVTSTPASGSTFQVGTSTVLVIAEDANGNRDSCTFKVIVVDAQKPTLSCPADTELTAAAGANSMVVNGIGLLASNDNCGVDTVYYRLTGVTTGTGANNASGKTFNAGMTTVTYFVKDKAGNIDSCAFKVNVKSVSLLAITCPANITIAAEANLCSKLVNGLSATVTPLNELKDLSYQLTGITTGSGKNNLTDTTFKVGITTVTYTATATDNTTAICNFTVKVEDKQAPVFALCPDSLVQNLPAGLCQYILAGSILPTATDNCTGLTYTYTPALGTGLPLGKTKVTIEAKDAAGNTASCVVNIHVKDVEAPVFSLCPNGIIAPAEADKCSASVSWVEPGLVDNCPGLRLTRSHAPNSSFEVGSTTVKYVARDSSGNESTCSFTVKIEDNKVPVVANMPNDIVVNAPIGQCGANVSWPLPSATDNCGEAKLESIYTPGIFFQVGTTTVVYKATDKSGNETIATFKVTVKDNRPPVFNCPSSLTAILDGGGSDPSGIITNKIGVDCQSIKLSFNPITAIDECGLRSIVQTEGLVSGSAFPLGITIQTFLATDYNGNQSTCSFSINVISPAGAIAFTIPNSPVCVGAAVTLSVNQYAGASYQWKDSKDSVVANSASFNLPSVSLPHGGTYTVSITLPTNCVLKSSVVLTVVANPQVRASANDLLCSGGGANLNLKALSTGATNVSRWIWQYPNGSQVQQQNPIVTNASVTNAGTYIVTGMTLEGCIATDTVLVSISKEPVMPPLFGTEASICKDGQVVLNGQSFSGNSVSYHWSSTPVTGSGLTAINNNIIKVRPTAAGKYIYYYYVTVDGCKSATAEWAVNVQESPILNVSVQGQTACVDGASSITLQETGGQAVSWVWEGLKTGYFSNQRNPVISNVNAAKSDNYKVTATTANGCTNTAIIPVQITNQPPPAMLIVNEASICKGANIVLTTSPNYGAESTFNWTGPDLPSFRPSVQNIIVTPSAPGNYTYTFQAVVNNCSTNVASVNIKVDTPPTVNITVDGEAKCLKGTSTVTLKSNDTGATSWKWTNSAGTLISITPTLNLLNATSASSDTYTIVASNSIGCESRGSLQLNITDALPPVTATMEAAPCAGESLRFSANLIPGASYLWKNPAGSVFSNIQSPIVPNASTSLNGDYIVTATKDGCSSVSAPLKVRVLGAPKTNSDDVEVLFETPKTFDVIANDQLISAYSISVVQQPMNGTLASQGKGVFTYTPDPRFREVDRMVYEVCYADCQKSCSIAQVTLKVQHPADKCIITSVISPNNDGINDEFIVSCLEGPAFPQNILTIFNQWGDEVYNASPYNNDWKGTFKGADLPDGTYFYIFLRDPRSPAEKGFVMIYR